MSSDSIGLGVDSWEEWYALKGRDVKVKKLLLSHQPDGGIGVAH
ncbi:hypothetical protein RAB80_017398 [Fusarium oxysporum f. sp. vasinfectum]|nr:hypothetical protein RAB80_017398 [Fusarium oxysporum f. sp. vasinfectum]